jgi:PhnB protein
MQRTFAPYLYLSKGVTDISFYEKAFDAVELRRWTNDDGSLHVAELSIDNFVFHVHEEKAAAGEFSPGTINGTTVLIGLFVPDVDLCVEKAIKAGGVLISAPQSYDYDYRQARVRDPFGHVWLIESKI